MVDESKEKDTTHITVTQETKADLEAIGKVRNLSGYNNIIQQLIAWRYERDFTLEEAVASKKSTGKYNKKKPPAFVIATEILLCWNEDALDRKRAKYSARTRTGIHSMVKKKLRSGDWKTLYPEFFELEGPREGITRYIDDQLKAMVGRNLIRKQNPEQNDGLYELDVASINEEEWMLLRGISFLEPKEGLSVKLLNPKPKISFNI